MQRLVLEKKVGVDDVDRLANCLGWVIETEFEKEPEVDRQTVWSVDDRTTFVRRVEHFAGFQYLTIKGTNERRVLNEICIELPRWSLESLQEAYRSAKSSNDLRAVLCAIALTAGTSFDEVVFRLLRNALESPDPATRATAVLATAYIRWRQWEPILEALVKDDPDAEVRRAATHMLAVNRKTVWAALGKERNRPRERWLVLKPDVAKEAVEIVMAKSPYSFVRQFERTETTVFQRTWATPDESLTINYREDWIIELNGMVMVGPESPAKDMATEFIRRHLSTWDKTEILALAKKAEHDDDLDLAIRLAGATACGAFDADLVKLIVNGLADTSAFIREGAAMATQYAPWPEVEEPLEEAIGREPDPEVKQKLEIALDGVRLTPEAYEKNIRRP